MSPTKSKLNLVKLSSYSTGESPYIVFECDYQQSEAMVGLGKLSTLENHQ